MRRVVWSWREISLENGSAFAQSIWRRNNSSAVFAKVIISDWIKILLAYFSEGQSFTSGVSWSLALNSCSGGSAVRSSMSITSPTSSRVRFSITCVGVRPEEKLVWSSIPGRKIDCAEKIFHANVKICRKWSEIRIFSLCSATLISEQ